MLTIFRIDIAACEKNAKQIDVKKSEFTNYVANPSAPIIQAVSVFSILTSKVSLISR